MIARPRQDRAAMRLLGIPPACLMAASRPTPVRDAALPPDWALVLDAIGDR